MDSVRISIINHDLSTTTVTPANPEYKGFTVVSAPKGPAKPVLISDLNELHNTFGYPSADYPELYEVEAFIGSGFPAYVSAPYQHSGSSVPVAYITKDAFCLRAEPVSTSVNFDKLVAGDNSVVVNDITNIAQPQTVLYPLTASFASVADFYSENENAEPAFYACVAKAAPEASFRVKGFGKDDTGYFDVTVTATNVTEANYAIGSTICNRYIISAIAEGNDVVGYTLSDNLGYAFNVVDTTDNVAKTLLVFTGSTSKSDHVWSQANVKTYVNDSTYSVADLKLFEITTVNEEDIHATIFSKNVENNSIYNVTVSAHSAKIAAGNKLALANRFKVTCTDNTSFEGSLSFDDKLESGKSLSFYEAQKEANSSVGLYIVKPFEAPEDLANPANPIVAANNGTSTTVKLDNGSRLAGDSETGWKYALEEKYHDVNIFFDPAVHFTDTLNSNSNFFKIANEDYHPLAGCIFNAVPFKSTSEAEYITAEDISTISPLTYGANYWNICNVGKKAINGRYVYLSLAGVRAASQMRILKDSFGGVAPMYTGSSQIPSGHIDSLLYEFNKKAQLALDENNYNAVLDGSTTNNDYGYIIASHKTCKSGELTDWSYIGHVASFLQFEREIRDNVMFPQIGKANNEYYRSLRKYQAEEILRKRISGPNPIWAEGIVDTSTNPGVNDIAAQKARKFIINIRVKVNVFSEWVELNFTNVAQDMTV